MGRRSGGERDGVCPRGLPVSTWGPPEVGESSPEVRRTTKVFFFTTSLNQVYISDYTLNSN